MKKNVLSEDLDYILLKTQELWEELRNKRILITGGTGFFGCWLLESFCWANEKLRLGAEAVVLTRNPEKFRGKVPHLAGNKAIILLQGDVGDFEFPLGEFYCVIHAATEASASLNDNSPLVMFDTIVNGTRRCLEFARAAGAKKFLLTSSGAVYGRQPPEIPNIPEDYTGAPDTMDPKWVYGEGKRTAEILCSTYSKIYGIESKIARCWAFVGPYLPLDIHFAIGNFIRDGMAGGTIKISGDGTPFRSYMYAADLTVWLWTILFKGVSCRPYNVGSSEAVSIAETAKIVAECCQGAKVTIAKVADPLKPAERYVPEVIRGKTELGFNTTISLSTSILKTIEWHKKTKG